MDLITSGRLPNLTRETRALISQVPKGMVTTYGAIAEALGDIRASRFVALVQKESAEAAALRIVRSDGSLGGAYATRGQMAERSRSLRAEGVPVVKGRVPDLEAHLFVEFKSSRPLEALRKDQLRMREGLVIPSGETQVDYVAGVDVAYDDDHAWAAMVLHDFPAGNHIRTECVSSEVDVPYIPTYLAYRELPVVKLLKPYLEDTPLLMYDGNGILHPEGFGVASHAGVLFDMPTIGVAKRLLCGSVAKSDGSDASEVLVKDEVAGHVLSHGLGAPVYVSPGHMISHGQALSVARSFLKHRIPEPIRAAHAVATNARRVASNK